MSEPRLRPTRSIALRRAHCLAVFAVLGVAVLAGCGARHQVAVSTSPASTGPTSTRPASRLRGLLPKPLPHKPDFTLTDTGGRRFNLLSKTRGKLTYLYFGYTHCPDFCPLTMSQIAAALRRQPTALHRRVEVIFVTVDPRRDTPAALRAWLTPYGPSFVGLTGSEAQIRTAEQASGVPLAPPEKTTGANYSVQHSSLVIAYSPDDRAHVVYAQGFTVADYAHDMPILLKLRARA